MALRNIVTTVAVEGEAAYRTALKNINSELGLLQSELKKTTAQYQNSANTEEALQSKVTALQNAYDAQTKKIETLRSATENCRTAQNKWETEMASTRTQLESVNAKVEALDASTKQSGQQWNTYEARLKSAKAELKNLQSTTDDTTEEEERLRTEISSLESKMAQLDDATDGTASQTGALLKEQQNLTQQLDAQQTKYDTATTKANNYAKQLNNAETEAYKLDSELQKNTKYLEEAQRSADGCASSIDEYGKEVKDTTDKTDEGNKSVQEMSDAYQAFGTVLATAGVIKALREIKDAIQDCIDTFAEFEETMSKVSALSGATGDDLQSLTDIAKEMGATTSYTASEAADALSYMALAGWDTEEMLEGLEPILNLAASSAMDLGTASDIVTDYLTAFGLSASDAAKFVDEMAYAQANSNTTTEQLGEAYQNCAATAASMGFSVEEVTAVLMTMANAGVKGGEAGTALNTIMTRLATNTSNCTDVLQDYVDVYDENGNMASLSTILQGLADAWDDMSQEEQAAAGKAIAGTRQYSKLATIMEGLSDDAADAGQSFSDYAAALADCTGTAGEQAETMLDNLSGKMTLMESAADGLKIEVGEQLAPALGNLVDAFTNVLGGLTNFIEQNDAVVPILTGVTTALTVLVGGLTVATVGMKVAAIAAGTLNAALGPVSIALMAVGAVAGVAVAAFTAISSASSEAKQALADATEAATALNDTMAESSEAYDNTVENTEATAEAARGYIDTLKELEAKTSLSSEEQDKYNQTCALLLNLMPDLEGTITTTTDEFGNLTYAIDGGTDALEGYIDTWEAAAKQNAAETFVNEYYTAYNAAYSEWYSNQALLLAATAKQEEAEQNLADAYERRAELADAAAAAGKNSEEQAQLEAVCEQIVQYKQDIKDAEAQVKTYTEAVETSEEALADAEDGVRDAQDAYEAMTAELDDTTEATEATTDAYQDLGEAAKTAANSGGDLRAAYEDLEAEMEAIEDEGSEATIAFAEQQMKMLDLKATVQELAEEFGGLVGTSGVIYVELAENLQAAGVSVEEFAAQVADSTDDIINDFELMDTSLDMSLEEMEENLRANIEATAEWTDNIDTLWQAAVESGDESAMAFVQTLYDMGPAAAEQVAQMVEDVDGTLAEFAPLFEDAGTTATKQEALGIEMTAYQVADAAADAAEDAVEAFGEGDFEEAGSAAAELLATGLELFRSSPVDEAADIADDIEGEFTATPWATVGSNITSGLASGMNSGKSSLLSTATSLATSAYNAAKKALGINSPSKVMAEVGKYYDEGFAQGIADNLTTVTGAVTGVTAASIPDATAMASQAANTYITNNSYGADESGLVSLLREYLPAMLSQMQSGGNMTAQGIAKALSPYMDRELGVTTTRRNRGN